GGERRWAHRGGAVRDSGRGRVQVRGGVPVDGGDGDAVDRSPASGGDQDAGVGDQPGRFDDRGGQPELRERGPDGGVLVDGERGLHGVAAAAGGVFDGLVAGPRGER